MESTNPVRVWRTRAIRPHRYLPTAVPAGLSRAIVGECRGPLGPPRAAREDDGVALADACLLQPEAEKRFQERQAGHNDPRGDFDLCPADGGREREGRIVRAGAEERKEAVRGRTKSSPAVSRYSFFPRVVVSDGGKPRANVAIVLKSHRWRDPIHDKADTGFDEGAGP